MSNPEVELTLEDCVAEVLGILTGQDLTYAPELDRFRAITRQLNRALRANALENEWSYYSSVLPLGSTSEGINEFQVANTQRVRIINDDAVRLVDPETERPIIWAYMLPRDSLHKYAWRQGLWSSVVRRTIYFSRPLRQQEAGLEVHVPVMREPRIFRLPDQGKEVAEAVLRQPLDFEFPDVIVARAAYLYAQADPVMQPRAQTLEAEYKNMMYQLIERDTAHTDSAYVNEFIVPIESSLRPEHPAHLHPHA